MPRKPSKTLTEAEQRLMEVVWERGEASVAEVADALPDDQKVAYNTVLTTLRILESKGYVDHRKDGRAFVYRARVGREQARRHALQELMRRFFDGSPKKLALNLFLENELDPDEIAALRAELEDGEG